MTDVSKVKGPSGAPERPDKESSSVDADKFQAAMRKRALEVGNVDPDEQKKRKRQEEAEEEEASRVEEPTLTPPESVPLFSAPRTSPELRLDASSAPALPPPPTHSQGALPYDIPPSLPLQEEVTPPPSPPSPRRREEERVSFSEHAEESSPEKKAEQKQPFTFPHKPERAKKGEKASSVEPGKKTAEEEDIVEEPDAGVIPQTPSSGKTAEVKEEKGISVEEGAVPPSLEPPLFLTPTTPPSAITPYAHLASDVQVLFDKMVGVMTVMNVSGITETTFVLNAPQFASSVFFGAQIIIKEFSTAPLMFNIQLSGSTQAVELLQRNMADLVAAFQAGNYSFKVHRLETQIARESPYLFKRKEGVSDEQESDEGESKQ